MGWIIASSVLGAIVLVIFIILMLPIYMYLKYDDDGKVTLYFKILWFKFAEEPDPDSAFAKAAEKIAGISKFKDLETIKKTIKEESLSAATRQFIDVITSLFKQLVALLVNCTVNKLHIKMISASSDAAEAAFEYGISCAIIYSLMGYIEASAKMKQNATKLNLMCDYNSDDSKLSFDIILSIRIYKALAALYNLIKENQEKEIYE